MHAGNTRDRVVGVCKNCSCNYNKLFVDVNDKFVRMYFIVFVIHRIFYYT